MLTEAIGRHGEGERNNATACSLVLLPEGDRNKDFSAGIP